MRTWMPTDTYVPGQAAIVSLQFWSVHSNEHKEDSSHSNINAFGLSPVPEGRHSLLSEQPWGIPAGFWVLILEGACLPGTKNDNCSPMSMSGALQVEWESCIHADKSISRNQNIEITLDIQGLHHKILPST